ncbi:LuxR C-terminal-related transcriptional regulator [Bradyrhizobium daqingense]|uniref:Two component transcriptional regulator, LuxR family n=1 Tax=Bradyrhizobium daqingense TaxID=993502 RepID=A0A562LQU1_9BRAD|nr:LuxR C-terminal-related transcriptional regulator [Bradyrhizobium daqingense]TWI09990.1 two component transcriptional regulator, LuxR family [Bradyrhizobium daqingense]UFS88299.1 LuxR C-terminal-related transcriptional regulator [Bradyrhizobium daqingense]
MLDASAKQGILKPIRLVLSDRQPVVLQGLRSILGTLQDFDVVASTSDGTSCLHAIRDLSPDVALIADTLPDLTASDILAIAKAEKLSTRLVFFTESDTNHALTAAIATGACSAISKYVAPGAMLRSLRLMAKSGVSLEQSDLSPTGKEADRDGKIEKMLELLTPRERQIVRLVSEGMSNKEIARKLDLSHGTVKVHLYNIFQKLEITNRTVLATISLLQRTSGFGALAVAFLAFAIADELKAADAHDMLAHDDGLGQRDEHAGFEVWKKAILQHLIVSKSGGTPASTEKDLLAKAVQATDPAAAMEALRAAEQLLGSKFWKEGGAVGSGTNNLPAHLLAAITATGIGGGAASEHQIPQPASNSMSIHGGYGTFASIAGALIYALNDPQLAQAHESGQAAIDDLLASIGHNATTTQAASTHVDTNHAAKSAPEFLARDFNPHSSFVVTANNGTQEGVQVQAGPDAAGHTLQKSIGLPDAGHDSGPDGSGRDQPMGGNVEDVVHRAPIDSKSGSSDSAPDGACGPDRLNLAAFGALAWLHLTAAAKSIPPHTLAWIYDPATNQTIVYVNPTDRALDVGDHGLLEFHLQGIVSVAESGGTHPAEGVAVAVTLEQLEQALITATSTDETGLSLDDNHASESLPEAAAVWNVSAADGWNFHVAHVRTGSGTSANSSAARPDSAGTAEESAGASSVTAYGSSTPPAVETPTSKNGPTNPNAGAPSTAHNEIVPSGLETADSTGRGNSEHASDQGQSKGAAAEKTESKLGNGAGNGNEHQSDSPPGAAKTAKAEGADHGNSGHSASDKGAEAGESDAKTGNTEHGPGQHPEKAGSAQAAAAEVAETKAKPGHGPTHDSEHHSKGADTPPTAAEPGVADHGTKQASAADGSDHGQSQRDLHVSENSAAADKQQAEHDSTEHESNPGELHRDLRASKDLSATAEQQEKGNGFGGHADSEQSQRDLHEAHSSVSGKEHVGASQKADRTDRAAADTGPAQKAAASEPRDSFHFRNDPAEPKHSDDAGVGHGPDILEHGRHDAGHHGLALDQAADLIGPSHAEQSAFDHPTVGEHHLSHHWLV